MPFREVQQFRQWWLWLLIAPGPVVIWYRALRHLVFESSPRPSLPQIVSWLIGGIALPVLLYSIRLVTEVRNDGLYLRFSRFTFHSCDSRQMASEVMKPSPTVLWETMAAGASAMGGMGKLTTLVETKAFSLNSTRANGSSSAPSALSSF